MKADWAVQCMRALAQCEALLQRLEIGYGGVSLHDFDVQAHLPHGTPRSQGLFWKGHLKNVAWSVRMSSVGIVKLKDHRTQERIASMHVLGQIDAAWALSDGQKKWFIQSPWAESTRPSLGRLPVRSVETTLNNLTITKQFLDRGCKTLKRFCSTVSIDRRSYVSPLGDWRLNGNDCPGKTLWLMGLKFKAFNAGNELVYISVGKSEGAGRIVLSRNDRNGFGIRWGVSSPSSAEWFYPADDGWWWRLNDCLREMCKGF